MQPGRAASSSRYNTARTDTICRSIIHKYRQSGQDPLCTSVSLEFCIHYIIPAGKGCKFFLI